MSNRIFVDTSWYKAFLDQKDNFFSLAIDQYKKIKSEEIVFVTTNFVIDETLTLIRIRCGLQLALKFRDMLSEMDSVLQIARVLPEDEENAWKWFPKDWSKLSFTDCTSFAVMKRLEISDVATFDNHFTQAGFKVFK